ncbi:MAG: HAMP domain-containing sensor histidine kinase [Vicinamibacterales bacterium]
MHSRPAGPARLSDTAVSRLALVAALADRDGRALAAKALADHVGAADLFAFVADVPGTGRLVPAPGFRATLPGGAGWRDLLGRAVAAGLHTADVRYPGGDDVAAAFAWSAAGVTLVFIGGQPDQEVLDVLDAAAPLLLSVFQADHAVFVAEGNLRVASDAARQASALTTALDRARAELEQTVRFNELFAAILGHDLRNPLGVILTAAHLALRRTTDENTIKPLKRILSSGERMTRMTEQLLDFARARLAGGITLTRRDMDLEELVRHLLDEEEMANPAWAFDQTFIGNLHGHWDQDRLAQAFSNLFSNAVQHGSPDEPLRVRVDGSLREHVEIQIANKGAIPEDLIPILFDPFRGTQHRTHGSRGLGLGLFITEQIITVHGGQISVSSSDEAGTRFTVRLPRSQPAASTTAKPS